MSAEPSNGNPKSGLTFKQGLVLVILFLAFAATVAFVKYQPNYSLPGGRFSPWRIEPERPPRP